MQKALSTAKNHAAIIAVTGVPYDQGQLNAILLDRLKNGIVHFAYSKADGIAREAFGTLDPKQLPPAPEAKPGADAKPKKAPNPNVQSYYDLGVKDWRAFSVANLLIIY